MSHDELRMNILNYYISVDLLVIVGLRQSRAELEEQGQDRFPLP